MVGHTSERRRRNKSEVEDVPKKVEIEEGEQPEVEELDPHEPREPKRPQESEGEIEPRLRKVIDELEVQERSEESVSQRMERAIGKLEDPEKPSRSTEGRLREVIEDLEEPVNDTKPELQTETDTAHDEVRFESMEDIDLAVEQHPHVKYGLSPESYDTCEQYIRVISDADEVSVKEIAEREELSEEVVESWREGVRPKPVESIEIHEQSRLEHEREVSKEALEHRIAPEEVHEVASDSLEKESLPVKELSDLVHDIHQRIESPEPNTVHYAELYDTEKPLTEDRLREISTDIYTNREVIQAELNARLGLDEIHDQEVRIAVTDSRLYYWHINTSPDEWVNVLEDQKFYMSKEDKAQLIDDMREHLHIRGGGQTSEYYLNDLMNQISGLEDPAANRIRKYDSVYSFDGEVMHIIGDLQGKRLEDFKPIITHMGTKEAAQVSNLHFPELGKFRMRFVAIAESDAHLAEDGRLSYYEKNEERMKIAIEFYQEFGDFEVKIHSTNKKRLDLPRLYGAMAEKWGIPKGDKAIHNRGLHDTVKHAPLEDKPWYPREMVPEDGCFSDGKFSMTRGRVLHAGKRSEFYEEKYGIKPLVNQELIDFVREKGAPMPASIGYEDGERIGISIGEVKRFAESDDELIAEKARELQSVVYSNPNSLIIDETEHIMKSLGIELVPKPSRVYYFKNSERLSSRWDASTTNTEQAIRWALIAPPNHPEKMEKVVEFLKPRMDKVNKVSRKIMRDGLEIHPIWNNQDGFDFNIRRNGSG